MSVKERKSCENYNHNKQGDYASHCMRCLRQNQKNWGEIK